MSSECEKDGRRSKRPYVKPEVKQVPLRPEEAVLGFCKNTGGYGPTATGCKPLGNCSGMGS
jgi:hypothetical protein